MCVLNSVQGMNSQCVRACVGVYCIVCVSGVWKRSQGHVGILISTNLCCSAKELLMQSRKGDRTESIKSTNLC